MPERVTSRIASDTPAALIGSQSTSLPISATSNSMRCNVDAIVNSRMGAPTLPLVIINPDAPTEKSPLIELTPLCKPCTDCTKTPSSMSAIIAAWSRVPGCNCKAIQPTPGVPLNPPRTALPVLRVAARRAL